MLETKSLILFKKTQKCIDVSVELMLKNTVSAPVLTVKMNTVGYFFENFYDQNLGS